MNLDHFSRRLQAMNWRAAGIQQELRSPDLDAETLLLEAFEALGSSMEELTVAEEELRLQNETLLDAQVKIEAERRRYFELFEFAPDGYLVTDLTGLIRDCNRAAAALLNVAPMFLVGKPLATYVSEEHRRRFRERLLHLHEGADRLQDWEIQLRPRLGAAFDAELTVLVDRKPGGAPEAYRWMLRDITERKQEEVGIRTLNAELERRVQERTAEVEEALMAAEVAEQRFRAMVHGIDAIAWEADAATGRFTFVSQRGEEVLGYPVEQWLSGPDFWVDHIHPEDREWAVAHRNRAIRSQGNHEFEYRLIAADGRVMWFRESVHVIRDDIEPDRVRELRGLMVNITKRKKAERQLYVAKRELAGQLADMTYLHELFGRLPASLELEPILDEVLAAVTAILETDLGLLMLYDGKSSELYPAAGVGIDDELVSLIPRVPAGVGVAGIVIALHDPILIEDIESSEACAPHMELFRQAGVRSIFCTPLLTREGEILGTVSAGFRKLHRPSERRLRLVELYARQAEHFIESAQLLEEARREARRKDIMLATAVHELRNPLAPIVSSLQLLRSDDEGARDEAQEVLERQVAHLAQLVEGLLDTARITQDMIMLHWEPVDVDALVARALESSRPIIDAHGHALTLILPPEPMELDADPTRLVQVLANLLVNAAKYTPGPGGKILLSAAREDDEVVLRVRDTGIGIDPHMLPRIFDLFVQDKRAAAMASGGLGIGLTLVRRLVELHGGTVTVSSAGLGHGSEFTVRLPMDARDGERPGAMAHDLVRMPKEGQGVWQRRAE
jgi:PAS domain S-box-containing protein